MRAISPFYRPFMFSFCSLSPRQSVFSSIAHTDIAPGVVLGNLPPTVFSSSCQPITAPLTSYWSAYTAITSLAIFLKKLYPPSQAVIMKLVARTPTGVAWYRSCPSACSYTTLSHFSVSRQAPMLPVCSVPSQTVSIGAWRETMRATCTLLLWKKTGLA